jgi:hypothetical protein
LPHFFGFKSGKSFDVDDINSWMERVCGVYVRGQLW